MRLKDKMDAGLDQLSKSDVNFRVFYHIGLVGINLGRY